MASNPYTQAKFKPTGHRRPVHRPRDYEQREIDLEKFYVTELYFNRQGLTNVPDLSEYPNLEFLILHDNDIADIKGHLYGLVKLEFINLARNRLTEIRGCFDGVDNLRRLALYENQLVEIRGCFDGLDKLESIGLRKNPLSDDSKVYLQELKDKGVRIGYDK